MKLREKILILLFITLFTIPFFSFRVIGVTTIRDTGFGIDEGKTYEWKVTAGPPYTIGGMFSFTTTNISQGIHLTTDALIVECTIRTKDPVTGNWTTEEDDVFYIAANMSQNYFVLGPYLMGVPIMFAIPLPLNLSLVAEALIGRAMISNNSIVDNSIVDNTIISNSTMGIQYKQTYNNNGILTKFVTIVDGEDFSRMDLVVSKDEISFSGYFLFFTILSIIGLVYWKKLKIK